MNSSTFDIRGGRILLNFLPISAGGGLQNALSFVETLGLDRSRKEHCLAIVRKGSAIEMACRQQEVEAVSVEQTRLGRLLFECGCRTRFTRGQACFTLFGPPMLTSGGYLLNINGCAYSNLFYPEIQFWSHYSCFSRMRREAIDWCRRHQTAQADYWIFETEALRRRALSLCGFPPERVGVVRMTPSALVAPEKVVDDIARRFDATLPQGFRLLFLNGANRNKRLHALPSIAAQLRRLGVVQFCFVCTLPPEDRYTTEISREFVRLELSRHFVNLGPVPPQQAASLVHTVNAICTFSVLESFSNNFVEAWKMERPLVVTDADWAQDSCGNAALYLNPADAASAAEKIRQLIESPHLRQRLIEQGRMQLGCYPNVQEKLDQYFGHIESALRLGPCPVAERARIRWPRLTGSQNGRCVQFGRDDNSSSRAA